MMNARQQREISNRIDNFSDLCRELKYTDTQEAWDILNLIRGMINAEDTYAIQAKLKKGKKK